MDIRTILHYHALPIALLTAAYGFIIAVLGEVGAVIPQLLQFIVYAGIYVLLATGLNLDIGYTGLLNLGHIAFFGVGAYTSALLATELSMPFLPAFIAAGIVAGIFGVLLVAATRKVIEEYLALATLGFAFVVYSLLLNWQALTYGPQGVAGIPKPEILGISFGDNAAYALLVTVIATLGYVFMLRVTSSRYGKLLEAVRDNERGAAVLGKNTRRLKMQAMGISAVMAGMAGSLFAHYITFIDPSSFYLHELILVLIMVFVGGLASMRGTLIAVFIVLMIPEVLRLFAFPSSIVGPLEQIVYLVGLLLILFWRPRGLWGRVDLE